MIKNKIGHNFNLIHKIVKLIYKLKNLILT